MSNYLFEIIISVFLFIILIVLFFMGALLVQIRRDQINFFSDMVNFLGQNSEKDNLLDEKNNTNIKNWDEKYESELDDFLKRSRQQSGLTDL